VTKRFGSIFLIVFVVFFFTSSGYSEDNEKVGERPEMAEATEVPVNEDRQEALTATPVEQKMEDRVEEVPKPIEAVQGTSNHGPSKDAQFSVQVEACLAKNYAEEKVVELRSRGYDAYTFQGSDSNGQTWYVVRIGDYEDLEKASEAASNYREREKTPAVITQIDSLSVVTTKGPKDTLQEAKESQETTEAADVPVEKDAQETGEVESPDQETEAGDEKDQFVEEGDETATEEVPKLKEFQEQLEILQEEVQKLRQEAEARKELKVSEEEEAEREREILEAASREYTLARKGTVGMNYSFSYSYSSYDAITEVYRVEHRANHDVRNSISGRYAILDNLTVNGTLPLVYSYDQVGTDQGLEATDLGDISFGLQWQPVTTVAGSPSPIVSMSISLPTGRSPYDIIPNEDLSTGSGHYSTGVGMSVSGKLDPLITYGGLSYSYSFPVSGMSQRRGDRDILNEVKPGGGIGVTFGIAHALSYKTSINMGMSYSHSFGSEYVWNNGTMTTFSGAGTSASFNIGTGWKLTSERRINLGLGFGLTGGSDFSFSFGMPLDFKLGKN
jgi:hypothetical protein